MKNKVNLLLKVPFFEYAARDDGHLVGVASRAEIATQIVAIAEVAAVLRLNLDSASGATVVLLGHDHFETGNQQFKKSLTYHFVN